MLGQVLEMCDLNCRAARRHRTDGFTAVLYRPWLGCTLQAASTAVQGGQLGWAFQRTLYNQPVNDADLVLRWLANGELQHVFIHFLLYRTSVHRVITSSLLLLSHTWVSEAQDSLWHKKEVARISLRRIQAC